jgi:hypothetical protein
MSGHEPVLITGIGGSQMHEPNCSLREALPLSNEVKTWPAGRAGAGRSERRRAMSLDEVTAEMRDAVAASKASPESAAFNHELD